MEVRTDAEVKGISRDDADWVLTWGSEGKRERFSAVINAAWEQRLRLDGQVGLPPPRRAIHRFKVAYIFSMRVSQSARPMSPS